MMRCTKTSYSSHRVPVNYLAVKIQLVEVAVGDICHREPVDSERQVLLLTCDLNVMPLAIVQ